MKETVKLNNRYRILQTIGRGGFGETLLAIDTHMPSERKCVIKQLKPAIQPPQPWLKDRFQREAAILEELGENNLQIPRLYAYFTEADNFYLVQEWIQGVNLQEKQEKEGKFSEETVKDIITKLLPVLAYTHNHKIIHRDIKPENILLRNSDRLPVLIDFGAVKEAIITQAPQSNSVSLAIGTPGYMPSEQAAGRPVYSSDLYSLGLTAVYLLTGCHPQDLETDSKTGEILWRKRAPELHSNLASVIDRAIRFHPRDRFATSEEMLAALTLTSINNHQTAVLTPKTTYENKSTPINGPTVAIDYPTVENTSAPLKLLLPLFLGGGIIILGILSLTANLLVPQNKVPEVLETVKPEPPVVEPKDPIKTLPDITLEPHLGENIEPYATSKPIPESETNSPKVETTPEITPESPPQPHQIVMGIPDLTIGAKQSQIFEAIGKPDIQENGRRPNTKVWSYQDLATGVNVRYTFDTSTEEMRQTQAVFAEDSSLEVMETTMKQLLGGKIPSGFQTSLKEVYENKIDLRSLESNNTQIMISRTWGKINIIISASDFY